MKWMIASDLHGSYYYAQQLQQAFEREQADRLLFLGDLLYHGPRNDLPRDYAPKKVIPLLNSLAPKLLCVRGNCDAEVDPVSYTHLDVYKRQPQSRGQRRCSRSWTLPPPLRHSGS